MKLKRSRSKDAKARKKRALAIVARADPREVPVGVELVDFREPSPAERAHGKSLEARARALLSQRARRSKIRKLAASH